MGERRTHGHSIQPQLRRTGQAVVAPQVAQWAERRLCDVHAVTAPWRTSASSSLSPCSWLPRYSKCSTLSRASLPTYTLSRADSATRLLAVFTALSVSVPSRDRCVRQPSHHRATWTLIPRCLVNSRPHESHLWERPSVATSASVVASTRTGLWTCIALFFLMEITIAASVMEPVASAVTRVEASAAFSSTRTASSAYSNLLTRIALSASPTTIPELTTSWSLKILSRPAMKHTGEKISPCNTPRSMLNGSDNMLSPLGCLMRTTPVAAAKIA